MKIIHKFFIRFAFLFLAFFVNYSGNLWSQTESCGTDVISSLLVANQSQLDPLWPCDDPIDDDGSYIVPLVFHIMHNNGPEKISDAQVISAVASVNQYFASQFNTKISFVLAKIDKDCNPSTGIDRTQTTNPTGSPYDLAVDLALKDLMVSPAQCMRELKKILKSRNFILNL